jgi:heme/copper-type cytochrome/quinol oxidase subunit 2
MVRVDSLASSLVNKRIRLDSDYRKRCYDEKRGSLVFTWTTILYGSIIVLVIAGLFFSLRFIKRQENKEFDKSVSRTMVKHQILGNPAAIVILVSFVILLGIALLTLVWGRGGTYF